MNRSGDDSTFPKEKVKVFAEHGDFGADDEHGALAVIISKIPSDKYAKLIGIQPYQSEKIRENFQECTIYGQQCIAAIFLHLPPGRCSIFPYPGLRQKIPASKLSTLIDIAAEEVTVIDWSAYV